MPLTNTPTINSSSEAVANVVILVRSVCQNAFNSIFTTENGLPPS